MEALALDHVLLSLAELLQGVGELAIAFHQGGLGAFALDDLDAQLVVGAHEFGGPVRDPALQLIARAAELVLGPLPLGGIPEGANENPLVNPALDQIILRAALHGLDGQRLIVEPGEDNDGKSRNALLHAVKGVKSGTVRQGQVEEDNGKAARGRGIQRGLEGLEKHDFKNRIVGLQ